MSTISDLPVELVTKILLYLDIQSLTRCAQICKFFYKIIQDSDSLRYYLELTLHGMVDSPSSDFPVSEKLRLLERHTEAWETLSYNSQFDVPSNEDYWELMGGFLVQADRENPTHIIVHQIPSLLRSIPKKTWTLDFEPIVIQDFGLDPRQDLLVVGERGIQELSPCGARFYLRTLSTGKFHPAVTGPPVISFDMLEYSNTFLLASYLVHISGDYLGVLVTPRRPESPEIRIWNWKTGHLMLALHDTTLSSMSFLTDRHIVLTHVRKELHRKREAVLTVVDFTRASSIRMRLDEAEFVCAFHWPLMGEHATTWEVLLRSGNPGSLPSIENQTPFHLALHERLLAVSSVVIETQTRSTQYVQRIVALVPSTTLLDAMCSLSPHEAMVRFPWAAWGPNGSRMFCLPPDMSRLWICYVNGMRFVHSEPATMGDEPRGNLIKVYDFNTFTVRQTASQGPTGNEADCQHPMIAVTDPSELEDVDGFFQEPVVTSLPYRIGQMKTQEEEFSAAMISDDAIVVVADRGPQSYRVFCF